MQLKSKYPPILIKVEASSLGLDQYLAHLRVSHQVNVDRDKIINSLPVKKPDQGFPLSHVVALIIHIMFAEMQRDLLLNPTKESLANDIFVVPQEHGVRAHMRIHNICQEAFHIVARLVSKLQHRDSAELHSEMTAAILDLHTAIAQRLRLLQE